MMSFNNHIPVLLDETLNALSVKEGGLYIDGTLGRAGHTSEILARGGFVLGIDRDDDALMAVAEKKKKEPQKFKNLEIVKGTHGEIKELSRARGWNEVDGILLDLGVSSPQLDDASRGFSFLRLGPLDMRMDQTREFTASTIINTFSVDELTKIFRELGEEKSAYKIAKAICKRREKKVFETTLDLSSFIEEVVGRHGAHHPATRVFQALRMAVNDEVGELRRALENAMQLLRANSRFVVITFESITDRIVKQTFASHVGKNVSLQQGGEKWVGALPRARHITRRAVVASNEEINLNPRSRSAKLRAIEIMQ